MNYWLFKSEPNTYSINDLKKIAKHAGKGYATIKQEMISFEKRLYRLICTCYQKNIYVHI